MSTKYQVLSATLKTLSTCILLGTAPNTIETIQALLIRACYSESGWLFTALAMRMALELDLPKAYTDVTATVLSSRTFDVETGARQFRDARVWFGVYILDHM